MPSSQYQRNRKATLPSHVELLRPSDIERHETEQFIHAWYKKHYGADVTHFLPNLLCLRNNQGNIQAVLGLREASRHPLFLEQYLDIPIEQALAAKINRPVDRSHLVEVGNLSASCSGGGRYLITALTSYLFTERYKWVIFTAGPALQNSFTRMGLNLQDLGPATPKALSQKERDTWGQYYEQKPRVMAGRIADGYHTLKKVYETGNDLTGIWNQAAKIGSIAI